MERAKVFGIGFHKTATTSLAAALTQLGYRVTGPNWRRHPNLAAEVLTLAYDCVPRFDAFQDNPWPLLYRELDQRFPGSRFILTVRPADRWIRSVVEHFGGSSTPMREWIYGPGHGDPRGLEDLYIERYERHNREVLAYFANRPKDLLVMNITNGDGWDQLCPFLGVPASQYAERPFPRTNSARDRKGLRRIVARLLNATGLRFSMQRAKARSEAASPSSPATAPASATPRSVSAAPASAPATTDPVEAHAEDHANDHAATAGTSASLAHP